MLHVFIVFLTDDTAGICFWFITQMKLSIKNGKIAPKETNMQEIFDAINRGVKNDRGELNDVKPVLDELHNLICRYLRDGITEGFLNEFNSNLGKVKYVY